MSGLPTAAHVLAHAEASLDQALRELSDARDWLKSDVDGGYTTGQAQRKRDIFAAVNDAKAAINEARHTYGDDDYDGL